MPNTPASKSSSTIATSEQASVGVMMMPPILSVESVEQVAHEMKATQIDKHRHVTLNFSQVNVLTSAGLQLIIALEKTLTESNGALVISEVKSAVSEVFSDLGFERLLRTAS